MNSFCGLDFGTSNTAIGVPIAGECQLVPLENSRPIMRSAIFCDAEHREWVFGQEGVSRYLDSIPGRLMMALKSVLGSELMNEETLVFNEFMSYSKILSQFISHVKNKAESYANVSLESVVMGRPVRFHDHDAEKDRAAQNSLEQIARALGFKEVSFQYEPIAAALNYETTIQSEQLALIIDMGGGTSDFTVIRLRPHCSDTDRNKDVLANCGIHIAGTDFDQKFSIGSVMPLLGMGSLMRGSSSHIEVPSMYYHDLTTWHTLSNLYGAKTINHVKSIQAQSLDKALLQRLVNVLQMRGGHHVLDAVETSKQKLSEDETVNIDLEFIENELYAAVTRDQFNGYIQDDVQRIVAKIQDTVDLAGVKTSDINAIFYTGGSTKIPYIRALINPLFPNAKIVQGDAFGSVGLGLALDAQRKYR